MKKKTLTIVMVIVAILIIVAVCIGLKSCSSLKDAGNGSTEVGKDGVVITDEDEKDETDAEDVGETIVADDVADWGDATEGIVDESVADKNAADKNTADKSNTDKNTADNNTTDKDSSDVNNTGNISLKKYTITYILNNEYATMDTTTQTVTYGQEFTLATPTIVAGDDYRFVKWVITGTSTEFKSGTYMVNDDISLTAVWEENYSKNY